MYIVFDIGATKMRVGSSKDLQTIDQYEKVSTPRTFEETVEKLKSFIVSLEDHSELKGVGGGIAGTFNTDRSELLYAENLPSWTGKTIRKALEQALQTTVYLENDCALIGLGEALKGAGKGYPIVAYLTVSTGVGGARIVDGKIDRTRFGFEPGHQIIENGRTLEQLISGASFEKRYGKKPEEITDPQVWAEANKWLTYGLNNTILHWSPDVVVLGGSIMRNERCFSLERIQLNLKEVCTVLPSLPIIIKSTLHAQAGLQGALIYLQQHLG